LSIRLWLQIGAVEMQNGKLTGEELEILVNPGNEKSIEAGWLKKNPGIQIGNIMAFV
jgi:DNA polymerase III epsilon subunit-like protein